MASQLQVLYRSLVSRYPHSQFLGFRPRDYTFAMDAPVLERRRCSPFCLDFVEMSTKLHQYGGLERFLESCDTRVL